MDEAAAERYTWAAALDKFPLTPEDLAGWTDWQLAHIAFHKRDSKDGSLVPPPGAKDTIRATDPKRPNDTSVEAKLATILALESARLITAENANKLREQLRNGTDADRNADRK